MKVLQVMNKVPYPAKDGGAIACMNLTKGFAHLGHEVTVLAMNTKKHYIAKEDIPRPVKNLARFYFVDVPAKINLGSAFLNFVFSRKPYNATRFINNRFAKQLEMLLDEDKFDIIQLEGLYVCPYIPIIRKKTKALIAYRAHNVEYEIWERTANMSVGLKKIYINNLSKRIKRFEKSLLNSYDVIVPITMRDGEMLDKMGNVKNKFISQTGIDTSLMVPCEKNLEYPSVFHLGSLEWSPNQEGLLWFLDKCWPYLYQKYPNLKFYIAGRRAPKWLVSKFFAPGVVYEGEIADAYDYMNSKAVMLVPLFSGSGMRVKIIEGMSLGKSIVSTPIGAEGIDVTNGENILIAKNPEEFIDAITELIGNRTYFDEIGRNAIDFIHKNFDNLDAASELMDFYKQNSK
jgi:glycosyltransferase involved in cell wall biosynthesis